MAVFSPGEEAPAVHVEGKPRSCQPFLIYGTGIRNPANPLKTKPRLRSNIRYSAFSRIMLRPSPPRPAHRHGGAEPHSNVIRLSVSSGMNEPPRGQHPRVPFCVAIYLWGSRGNDGLIQRHCGAGKRASDRVLG